MVKKIIYLILILIASSCSKTNQSKDLISEIENLKADNDSLKNIISTLNQKYIFDEVSVRHIESKKNTHKLNSQYETEIVVVGYNIRKDSVKHFPKKECLVEKVCNPYTVTFNNGGTQIKTKLDENKNWLQFEINTESQYGKKFNKKVSTVVKVKN